MSGSVWANAAATFNPAADYASSVSSLAQARQIAAQHLAGQQIAGGDPNAAIGTLNSSGNLAAAQQEQGYQGSVQGAQQTANRNYGAAAQAYGAAGDAQGVASAQAGQYNQYQILGSLAQQALPVLKQAYAVNGAAGLAHATGLLTQEWAQAGIMTPEQAQSQVALAGSDPQGFLSNADNFVQSIQYQKVGDNTLLGRNVLGQPVNTVTGATQTSLPTPGGGATLVGTPASIQPLGQGAPAPAQAPAAASTSAAQPASAPAAPSSGVLSAPTVGSSSVNNPGNLRPVGATSGFMNYATPQAGLIALSDDLNAKAGDGITSLAALASKYAPPGENNTAAWLQTVGSTAGITDPNAKIDLSNPNTRAAIMGGIVKAEGTSGAQLSGAPAPSPAASQAPASATTVLASTQGNGSLFRPATPSELPSGVVSAQVNSATGQLSNEINESDVNNLPPAAIKQMGEQYWNSGVLPQLGRGGGASAATQAVAAYAANKSAQLGLTGADDIIRHTTVQAAQKSVDTMVPQLAQLQTSENNAIDNANQIRQLLPTVSQKYKLQTFNELQNTFNTETNDPKLAALKTAFNDYTGDFAGVMFSNASGNGGKGNGADREEIKDLFNPTDSLQVIRSKLDQGQIGMRFRTQETAATLARQMDIMRTGVVPPSASVLPASGDQSGSGPSAPAPPGTPSAGIPPVQSGAPLGSATNPFKWTPPT